MINKLSGWDDTIIAPATAPGVAAIAVVRLSGNKSFEIIDSLFPSKNIFEQASHSLHVGLLKDGDHLIDEVVVSLFKGPKSYTGEDVVEISGHGSPFIQEQLIQACVRKGARIAKPGEFTQRAFLNGKLDLTQAEAVADLIASNTEASQKTALNNIRGGFSSQLKGMREQLIQFAALIELELDFAEEDVAFADRKRFYGLVDEIQSSVKELIDSFRLGNIVRNGISVAIIGKPNAGKSTLLNRLLNENRAIVSDIAGTTRDTIEEVINIKGILFRLIDTAGIHEHSKDHIEMIGIEKSLEKMNAADIVLYIFDVHSITDDELMDVCNNFDSLQIDYMLVANKIDDQDPELYKQKFSFFQHVNYISARENTGVNELKEILFHKMVSKQPVSENVIVTNARHLEALQQIQESLDGIRSGLDNKISGDLLAPDIRKCLYYLGEITGEVTNEDKLDYIFSKFYIGK